MNTLYLSLESDITLYCSTLLLKTESLSFLRLKERGSYRVGWHGVKHSDKNCGATQQMGKDEVDGMKTKHKKNYRKVICRRGQCQNFSLVQPFWNRGRRFSKSLRMPGKRKTACECCVQCSAQHSCHLPIVSSIPEFT